MQPASRLIEILAFANAQILDVTGPLQVFATANDLARERRAPPPYQVRVVATTDGPLPTSCGLAVMSAPLPAADAPCDTLIVAGGWGVYDAADDVALVEWLRLRARHCRRVASVCTGAFLLAASGLLDGRRVATHWTRCEQLARRYPALTVEANPIFIEDGPIWTSAGVTAGIDLALALVEADLGRPLALEVARHLVVFLKRPGGQAQFSQTLALQRDDSRFGELHSWIAEHLHLDLPVATLAARAGMSERSFVRHYRRASGQTPARAIEALRVEAARRLLLETGLPIKRIARQCGFGSEETLRRAFVRGVDVTPLEYRQRFAVNA